MRERHGRQPREEAGSALLKVPGLGGPEKKGIRGEKKVWQKKKQDKGKIVMRKDSPDGDCTVYRTDTYPEAETKSRLKKSRRCHRSHFEKRKGTDGKSDSVVGSLTALTGENL